MKDAIWDERRLRFATEAAGLALWSWNVDSNRWAMDEAAYDLWGLSPRAPITFEELSERIHPADLGNVRNAFNATREVTGVYDIDFRILHGDDIRWISARGRGEYEGIVGRVMYGVFLDVTNRKLAEESRDVILGEMKHRIKNLFSIASTLLNISSRISASKEDMETDLRFRLTALGSAHELIYPSLSDQKTAAQLRDLLGVLLDAYSEGKSRSDRISISTPDISVGEHSLAAVALIIHELATNSAKYGALSSPAGRIEVVCYRLQNDLEIVWSESGGPPAKISQRGLAA